MHGSAPLLRSVTLAATSTNPPASKIPHLAFHIIRRRTRPPISHLVQPTISLCQRRSQSTSVSLEDYPAFEPFSGQSENAPSRIHATSIPEVEVKPTSSSVPSKHDATIQVEDVDFYTILRQNSPDLIFLAFSSEAIGNPFIQNASAEDFDKALLMFDPTDFVDRHREIYRHLKYQEQEDFLVRGLRTIEERFDNYHDLLDRIVTLRQEAEKGVTLVACKHILKWAARLGDESLAVRVFMEVMKLNNIEADLACYNYYMQAMNWSNGYTRSTKFGFRALPLNFAFRSAKYRPSKFSSYRTQNASKGSVGIRVEILQCFKALCERGHTADEMTFINLMTAMGHEGDVPSVISILKSVWNIDVEMLETYDEDEIESPTFYEEDSPLRPSENLLYALAHIFGSNNDARRAWLLVDYVSRNYALNIPRHVWTELLEWYMVLSLPRGLNKRNQGLHTGQVALKAFDSLFDVMADEPHNMSPDAVAYYLQSRVGLEERHLDDQVSTLRGLRSASELAMDRMRQSMAQLLQSIDSTSGPMLKRLWDNSHLLQLRHQFITASLEYEACRTMMQHATTQYLLKSVFWAGGRKLTEWERRKLPTLMEEFAPFVPIEFRYRTTGGAVVLSDLERYRARAREPHTSLYRTMVQIRQSLDTEDHDRLLQGVLQLKGRMQTFRRNPHLRLKLKENPKNRSAS